MNCAFCIELSLSLALGGYAWRGRGDMELTRVYIASTVIQINAIFMYLNAHHVASIQSARKLQNASHAAILVTNLDAYIFGHYP